MVTRTTTVTRVAEPDEQEEASEFECPPLTATNSVGDTLELGDDCGLTFNPVSSTAAAAAVAAKAAHVVTATAAVAMTGAPLLRPRADDECVYTSTYVSTSTVFSTSTRTSTVTESASDKGFSCPTMAVTNRAGDELSLNEECELEFSPGSATPSSTAASVQGGSGGTSGAANLLVPSALIGVTLFAFIGACVL